MKTALITGIAGQDGYYLTKLLQDEGVRVVGIIKPYSMIVAGDVHLIESDLRRQTRGDWERFIAETQPDEIYHLAAAHGSSEKMGTLDANEIFETNLTATRYLLEAVARRAPTCHVFLAGSRHQFGSNPNHKVSIYDSMQPESLYGITKLATMHLGRYFRKTHQLHVSTGVLFNHESPRRKSSYVTQKIATAAREKKPVTILNLSSRADWGFAGDYVKAMRAMARAETPGDYVIATGVSHTVEDFARLAYSAVGLDFKDYVETTPQEMSDWWHLGDASPIANGLGWRPEMSFERLVELMVCGS